MLYYYRDSIITLVVQGSRKKCFYTIHIGSKSIIIYHKNIINKIFTDQEYVEINL